MTKNEFLSTSFLIVGLLLVAVCQFVFYSAAYFGHSVSEYVFNYLGVVATAILSTIAGRLMARENRLGWIMAISIAIEAVLETLISGFSHRNDESLVPIVAVPYYCCLYF